MNKHQHPEIYHKKTYSKNHFEGWYYKLVSADCLHTLSIIPGVSINQSDSHAFIQFLYHNKNSELKAYNVKFPISSFNAIDSPFKVTIEENHFSLSKIHLQENANKLKIHGSINFQDITPLQTTLLCPNIMGVFSYIPNMECNHGVLSMNHQLSGKLIINEEEIDFTNGKGYIEKDWGYSFPSKYIWIQSNHFSNSSVSLFCSIAKIPFFKFSFTGFICNFICNGNEYRFATYNHSKLDIVSITKTDFHIQLKNRHHLLEIKGTASSSKELLSPSQSGMNSTIKEGLSGNVHVVLKTSSGNEIYNGYSKQCGLELEF